MIDVPLETWVSLGSLLLVAVALYGAIHRSGARLESRMDRLEDRIDAVDARVGSVRAELKADIARLDDRVYTLAAGLRPRIELPRSG